MAKDKRRALAATQFRNAFNERYIQGVANLRHLYNHRQIILIDLSQFLSKVIRENPNVDMWTPCVRMHRTKYVFHDDVHPASWIHGLLATEILSILLKKPGKQLCLNPSHEVQMLVWQLNSATR